MRVAAIDLGTNTTRLLVADVDDAHVDELERRTTITRLGEGVDERRRLLPPGIARVRNCLSEYRRVLERLGAERTLAVGTSAIRDAENGEAFLGEIEWSYGFETRLLSGHDEAELAFRGVTLSAPLDEGAVVIDLGGGSTELVVGGAEGMVWHGSVDVGAVRLTDRFVHADPPAADEVEACRAAVREAFAGAVPLAVRSRVGSAVGVAGTLTTLAALDLGLRDYDRDRVDGHRLKRDGIAAQLRRLAAVPLAERRQVPALEPERAPVIVAGAVIAHEALGFFAVDEIRISERDLLDGVALAAADLPAPVERAAPPGAYTCC